MSITLVGRFGIPVFKVSQVFVKQLTPPERKTLVDKNLKNSDQKYVEPQIYLQLCRREIWIFLSGPQAYKLYLQGGPATSISGVIAPI